jgi:hypothetical protein
MMKKTRGKTGFTPISIDAYVKLQSRSGREDKPEELRAGLQRALRDYKAGVTCQCGNPMWVIGSAIAGNACFTCITGEVSPDSDYEIDDALN